MVFVAKSEKRVAIPDRQVKQARNFSTQQRPCPSSAQIGVDSQHHHFHCEFDSPVSAPTVCVRVCEELAIMTIAPVIVSSCI